MKNLELNSNIEQIKQQIAEQEMNYKIALGSNKSYPVLRRIKRKIKELENSKRLLTNESSDQKI